MFSPLEQFDALTIFPIFLYGYDFSFNNIILPLFLLNVFVIIIFILFKNNIKIIPEIWQYFFESLYNFIFGLIKQQIGHKVIFIFLLYFLFLVLYCFVIFEFDSTNIALTSHIIMIIFLSFTLISSIFVIDFIHIIFIF